MSRSKKRRFNIKNGLGFLLAFFVLSLAACGDQDGGVATLSLTADPASLPADGYSQSLLQATLVMADGEEVRDQTEVKFSIVKGEGKISKTSLTTGGVAHAILTSSGNPGTATIRATAQGSIAELTVNYYDNEWVYPVGEEFGISAEYLNISGLQKALLQNQITASAADMFGNAVPDGTLISFKTYNTGGFFPSFSGSLQDGLIGTTQDGITNALLHSPGTYLPPIGGFVSVTAETEGGIATHITSIAVDPQDSNIMFVGTSGGGVYKSRNAGLSWENISRTSSPLNPGQNFIDPYINDISINPDNPDAIYAATGYGGRGNIYRSLDGGLTWNSNNSKEWYGLLTHHDNASLFGTAVLTVLCDYGSDYVWAGTQDKGAFISTDGRTFSQSDGLGQGKNVREIVKASGRGGSATLFAATRMGVHKSTNGGSTWTRVTTFLGDNITAVSVHPDDPNTVYAGTQERGVWFSTNGGITWIRKPINDPEMEIKDLQVYHNVANDAFYLYAITYYEGFFESNATGNVYVVKLDSGSNYRPTGSWNEANMNLPERQDKIYSKTGKSSIENKLFAQHVMVVDNPQYSQSLIIGGEGINLFKATSGLVMGDPVWENSSTGLTNLIMARMPILFSGEAYMTVDRIEENRIVDIIQSEEGIEEIIRWEVTFQVYIEDGNGNPPISGSTFTVVQEVEDGDDIDWLDIEYADVYRHRGTWPDRSDPDTDNPYIIQALLSPGDKMVFTYEPTCGDGVPGCSGQDHELTYMY